jgi:hypothetical protein
VLDEWVWMAAQMMSVTMKKSQKPLRLVVLVPCPCDVLVVSTEQHLGQTMKTE